MLNLKELAEELDDLRNRRDTCQVCGDDIKGHASKDDKNEDGEVCDHDPESDDFDEDRLKALEALEKDLGGDLHVASRDKGPLYEDGYEWEEYAKETAYDLDLIKRGSPLAHCVDWKQWADDLSSDYTTVEFDGTAYYYQD